MNKAAVTPLTQLCVMGVQAAELALLQGWCANLDLKGRARHTQKAYVRDVCGLLHYLYSLDVALPMLNYELLSQFVTHRVEAHNINNVSLQREVSAIKQFVAYGVAHHQLWPSSPISAFKLKRVVRALPHVADAALLAQILDQPAPDNAKENQLWLRDKALLEMLYGSGLRVAEVAAVTLADVDFSSALVRVLGKGSKPRIVPIGRMAMAALNNWLEVRQQWGASSNALFISEKLGCALSTRTIERRVALQAVRAGVDRQVYPHLLRHCFASHMLSASQDLRAVQELLGHANISTTQIYTHLDFAHLTQVYGQSHPRAKKKKL